jgi:hypothetical protein
MLSVCSCVLSLKPLNQLTDSHKTLYENHSIVEMKSHGMILSIFYKPTTLAPPVHSPMFKILFSQRCCWRLKFSVMLCSADWKTVTKVDFWTHRMKTIHAYKMSTVLSWQSATSQKTWSVPAFNPSQLDIMFTWILALTAFLSNKRFGLVEMYQRQSEGITTGGTEQKALRASCCNPSSFILQSQCRVDYCFGSDSGKKIVIKFPVRPNLNVSKFT